MLQFNHVTFSYPGKNLPLMQDLSFQIKKGEFVCLVGHSGCGKSTIFRLVNQLLTPNQGEILVNGKNIAGQKNYCGYMPQSDLLFPWRSVKENVMLPLEIQGNLSAKERNEKAEEALQMVGLSEWADKSPAELSGGMRQRAAFARTVMTGSDLLLLDEPFSALDYLTRLSMREWLLQQWEQDKKTILFITHDVEEAVYLSNRVLVAEEIPMTSLSSVEVPAGYPRTSDRMREPGMLLLKEELIDRLRRKDG